MPDKGEERDKAQIKTLKRRSRMNVEKYKTEEREAKTMFRDRKKKKKKRAHDLKVLEGMKEATERNEARKFYATACGMKAGFQPQTSVCKDTDNNLTGCD
jgi:hypothetical protein